MDRPEMQVEARVTFEGRTLHLNKLLLRADLVDLLPSREGVMHPWEVHQEWQRQERRARLVDVISAEFAHALTEALYKAIQQRP